MWHFKILIFKPKRANKPFISLGLIKRKLIMLFDSIILSFPLVLIVVGYTEAKKGGVSKTARGIVFKLSEYVSCVCVIFFSLTI